MFNINVRNELAFAMQDLLARTPVTEISTTTIAAECGLSRRTFYNYFEDKYDLMAFVYYINSEKLWYRNGRICTFTDAYTRHINNEHLSPAVLRNMFSYVGQNDVREFIIKKVGHDMRRMFYYNHRQEWLKEQDLQTAIEMLTYGMCAMFEHLMHGIGGNVPYADNIIKGIPEKYRAALLQDPLAGGPRLDIPVFFLETCAWPPKLYLN